MKFATEYLTFNTKKHREYLKCPECGATKEIYVD